MIIGRHPVLLSLLPAGILLLSLAGAPTRTAPPSNTHIYLPVIFRTPAAGWVPGFQTPGLSSRCRPNMQDPYAAVWGLAIAPDGSVFVTGSIPLADGLPAGNIGRWDGSAWHAVPEVTRCNGMARGLDGYLYGVCRYPENPDQPQISRWDGGAWRKVTVSPEGDVVALAVRPDGGIYAGGAFTAAGGTAASNVALWDGTGWHALGGGTDKKVQALVLDGHGNLYAGGNFTTAGTTPANHISMWDGSQWHALDSGVGGGYGGDCAGNGIGCVRDLEIGDDGSLYVGGSFGTAGDAAARAVARWDGAVWHAVGSGQDFGEFTQVTSLAVGPDGSLYAGGYVEMGEYGNGIVRWDGSAWQPMAGGVDNPVWGIDVAPDGAVYVGGLFMTAGDASLPTGQVAAQGVARWDPARSTWHVVGYGNGVGGAQCRTSVQTLLSKADGSVYAGGLFTSAGDLVVNRIGRWDSLRWHALERGVWGSWGSSPPASINALAAGPDGEHYVGGLFDRTEGSGPGVYNIATWDGQDWNAVGSGFNGGVSALAVRSDGLMCAGGRFTKAGDLVVNNVACWDGTNWRALGSGINVGVWESGRVSALAWGADGALYAGGRFSSADGGGAAILARWDGSQWQTVGGGMDGSVSVLTARPDGLYVGGSFTHAGGVAVNGIARWDGTNWHALGSGVGGQSPNGVSALAFAKDGSLFAGGCFTTAGGLPANYIARWNGSVWAPVGSGTDGAVSALVIAADGSLYAGGSFTFAGGVPSGGIARWWGR